MTTKIQIQLRDRVLDTMKSDNSFLHACLLLLFEQQTFEEREIKNSLLRNAVGFNRPDAYLLSDYSIWKLNFPNRSIKEILRTKLINRLEKYALQLSSYREVVEAIDGLVDPTSIVMRIKNEVDVDKLDPTTLLEDYLDFKKVEREKEQREQVKNIIEKNRRKKLRLTHDIIRGTIVKITPEALKIKTTLENLDIDLWFPKFSIIKGYREELAILQEFMIKKNMLSSKREDALRKKRNHSTSKTKEFTNIRGCIVVIRPKALRLRLVLCDYEMEHWIPRYSIKNKFKEEFDVLQEFIILTSIVDTKKQDAIRLSSQRAGTRHQ
ncbi:MAG: hypothetical protein ACW98D_16780 [Promethearchaeota archaeon]